MGQHQQAHDDDTSREPEPLVRLLIVFHLSYPSILSMLLVPSTQMSLPARQQRPGASGADRCFANRLGILALFVLRGRSW